MFFNDPEDDEIDEDLRDDQYEPGEDFQTTQEEQMTYEPDDMEKPQFLHSCLLARVRGDLPDFLYALGIKGEDNIVKVNRILDEHFPTFFHQTDSLLELIENELSKMSLGGAGRVGDIADDGGFVQAKDSNDRQLKALQILYHVRLSRLKIRPKLEELNKC